MTRAEQFILAFLRSGPESSCLRREIVRADFCLRPAGSEV